MDSAALYISNEVSEELNSVETFVYVPPGREMTIVSEELNSVETAYDYEAGKYFPLVSEELNSVET